MSKTVAPEELTEAIRSAARGNKYVTPTLAHLLVSQLSSPAQPHKELRLSARELEVLRQLSRGQRLSEIATSLDISVKRVSTYRARLLEKLGFSNNADLVRYVMDHPEVLRDSPIAE